jgi:hypothetical protein
MKDSWSTRGALVLVTLLVLWNIYKGVTVQEIGIPGFTVKFNQSSRASELTGSWTYDLRSDVSQERHNGYIELTADGNIISGAMDNPDQLNPGERSPVSGTYMNGP